MDDTIHLAANAAPSDPPPDMAPPVAESPAPLACAILASPIEIRGKGVAGRLLETPALEKLAANPRWAVSTPNKMPLAVRDYCETGAVRGASCHVEEDMCTLWEIAEMLPSAPNAAYYLNKALDDYAVFDVESKASAELKRSFLRLRWSYAEVSMSGQGLHLLIPLKDISQLLDRYPYAQRRVIKAKDASWELHLEHWVTFTGMAIDPMEVEGYGEAEPADLIEDTLASLPPLHGFGIQHHAVDNPSQSIPGFELYVSMGEAYMMPWPRTDADYCFNRSSLDFAACVRTAGHLVRQGVHKSLNTDELRCVIEESARHWLESRGYDRPKLDEPRGELTYLGMIISGVKSSIFMARSSLRRCLVPSDFTYLYDTRAENLEPWASTCRGDLPRGGFPGAFSHGTQTDTWKAIRASSCTETVDANPGLWHAASCHGRTSGAMPAFSCPHSVV